jgi:hypothetical protein
MRSIFRAGIATILGVLACVCAVSRAQTAGPSVSPVDLIARPYDLSTGLESRSISFENPTGEKGGGGKTSSTLGVGRKGSPAKSIKSGETVQLCDISGPGTIRHIWIDMPPTPENLRGCVIRAWWEGQAHPGIECPVGDFMGSAHGKVMGYQSAVHSVGQNAGMNIWLPMPFVKRVKLTFSNEVQRDVNLFYQIDYTIGDSHPADVGRLHVLFRRENPTTMKQDFELLPKRTGRGRFIGSVIGIRPLSENMWGGSEVKVYLDGDTEFPTICGAGSEDYVGLFSGVQQTPYLYNGCSLAQNNFFSMYRWHLPDPIAWEKDCRITIQQIGWSLDISIKTGSGLYERQDDWSCATFWYEPEPSAPLPPMPDAAARTADIWKEEKK